MFNKLLYYLKNLTNPAPTTGFVVGLGAAMTLLSANIPSFMPIALLVVGILFIVDTISGIIKSLACRERLTIKGIWQALAKLFIYSMVFGAGIGVDIILSNSHVFLFSFSILCAILSRELASLFRNLRGIAKAVNEPWIFGDIDKKMDEAIDGAAEQEETTED